MKSKVISYRFGDIIRKGYEKGGGKPDDIGTKPAPRWLQDNQDAIKELFNDGGKKDKMKKSDKQDKINNQKRIKQLFNEGDKKLDNQTAINELFNINDM
jgi:hypothetical protein